MNKLAIIVSSHGYFAQEALRSAEMIIGKQENVGVVSITPDKDMISALTELQEVYAQLDTRQGTLILTDIIGGTPSNICGNLMMSNENILLYSGFNLPILLEVLLNRQLSLTEMQKKIEDTYQQSLYNLNEVMKGSDEDDQVD